MTAKAKRTKWILGLAGLFVGVCALAGPTVKKKLNVNQNQSDPVWVGPKAPHVMPNQQTKPMVEVVFALDTTGSMGGLIQGAKDKIWGIAKHISSGQPKPDLRVGLIGYRDKGDVYVTKRYDLNSDLDEVFQHLQTFSAEGGGDGPEHVNKALHDAVHSMKWSQGSMKTIFLVGDAPPHMDYNDGYDYRTIAKQAAGRGIVIHTIRCGGESDTGRVWTEIAQASNGVFSTIDQSGGVIAMATPMDAKLSHLSRRLAETAIIYGGAAAEEKYKRKIAAASAAPPVAAADRAGLIAERMSAGEADALDEGDANALIGAGVFSYDRLDADKLPSAMKGMKAPEMRNYVAKQRAEREAIQKEMKDLSAKRDAYLRANAGAKAEKSFDGVVNKAVAEQGKAYGLAY